MKTSFSDIDAIFERTKGALTEFLTMITPIIETSTEEHERLYWHHIYEEEEHRSDRLEILMPKIQSILNNEGRLPDNQQEFVHLLQDISIEKFGLHNFLEHLDLSLFHLGGTEFEAKVQELRNFTNEDYQSMKHLLAELNGAFPDTAPLQTAIPTDEKDGHDSVRMDAYAQDSSHQRSSLSILQARSFRPKKGLTIGSLKSQS
nr:IMEF encapsulin system ferritin-like cargo protein [uncultured Bacillus sp.]